jgi:dTMP kinase
MRFPDRTTATGKIINEYLTNARNVDDNAVHLLFAANRWEAKYDLALFMIAKLLFLTAHAIHRAQIEQHLREGTTVVLDRYAYSGAAFSAAKGIDLEWCKDPDRCLPAPDVVLYLKISIDAAMKRGSR